MKAILTLLLLFSQVEALEISTAGSSLSPGSIDTPKLKTDAVTGAKIISFAVDSNKIATAAVKTEKVNALAIDSSKIAALAVDSEKVALGAIQKGQLAIGAVETDRLASGAVTINKILAGAVDTGALGSGAVNTGKLLDDAVDTKKLRYTAHRVQSLGVGDGAIAISPDALTVQGTTALRGATTVAGSSFTANGAVRVNAGNGNQLTLNNAGEQFTQITFANNGVQKGAIYLDDTPKVLQFDASSDYDKHVFSIDAVDRFRIFPAANGGVGTDLPFTVSGSSLTVGGNAFSVGSSTLAVTGGNVGIGTVSPATKLHLSSGTLTVDGPNPVIRIEGTTDAALRFHDTASGAGAGDGFIASFDSPNVSIINKENGQIDLATNDTIRLSITGSGNLGVGTANPGTKLHVASGTLTVDGTSPAITVGSPASTPVQGSLIIYPGAAEAIVAAATITADACGGLKRINSVGAVTTSTINTFTAPAAANQGCCMDVINVDTVDAITLDTNANFFSAGALDVVLGPADTVRVCSTGASGAWYQVGATGNN